MRGNHSDDGSSRTISRVGEGEDYQSRLSQFRGGQSALAQVSIKAEKSTSKLILFDSKTCRRGSGEQSRARID
jgi:hypothetical protein